MMNSNSSEPIFVGDGEMSERLRSYDWSLTSLGSIASWPQSLKTSLNILFHTCCPMLLVWGRDRILFYNDAYASMLGQEQAALPFGHALNTLNTPPWSQIRLQVEQVFLTRRSLQSENDLFSGDGSPREASVYRWCYSPLWDEGEQVGGVFATGYGKAQAPVTPVGDTGCYGIEETLQQREEQLRLITNALPVLIAHIDTNHYYRFNNQAYETWFGQPAATFTNQHVRDVLGEAAYEAVLPYMQQALSGQRVSYESQVPYRKGGMRYIRAEYIPHRNSQGEVAGYFSLVSDISERKRTEGYLKESEERFRFVTQAVNGLIFDWNLQTNKVYRSERLYDLVGVHPQDASPDAEWWHERMHPDDLARLQPEVTELLTGSNQLYDSEYRVRHEDGHWVDVWEQACWIRNERGQVVRIVGCTVDISDRKQAEENLRESERRFRRLVESNMFGVAFGDFTGGIHYANDYFLNMIGYTRAELETEQVQWTEITPSEFLPLDQNAMIELKTKGVAIPFEKEYIRKDGSRIPVLIGSALLQEPYDQQQEIIGFFIDLTERKQAEAEREALLQQAQAAQAEAETANRIKDEFLAVLSHELRSPLNPILGWSKLLQTRQFSAVEMQHALQTIERNAKLQTQLIEDLLDVSRILRGKMALNICPVNLVTVIESALETVRLSAEAKRIHIQTFILSHIESTSGDPARLQQIVWNLLSNAIKFTPEGGRIEVYLECITNYAQIQVKDTGKGINPEFLPYVFDYFRQEDGKTTRKFGGLGLGLAIVRHLVELHGGTVQAESLGEGQGATFIVRLPLLVHPTESSQGTPTLSQTSDLSDLQILVVDDDDDMRELLQVILAQQGGHIRVAASAAEALRLFDHPVPDVVLSDIGMPEVDGYELMRCIRRRSPEAGGLVPAIALTAYAGEYDQQHALKVGFQRHVAKPVEPQELVRAIVDLLRIRSATPFSSRPHE